MADIGRLGNDLQLWLILAVWVTICNYQLSRTPMADPTVTRKIQYYD
jgi:hypothetical protein